MEPFKSILVDVDASAAAHPALDRAIDLARTCGARLRIVDALTIPADAHRYLPRGAEHTLIGRRREQLAAFAGRAAGLAVDFDVLRGRPATALVQEVVRSGHDLLVRSHARDMAASGSKTYGAVDMQLFRQCPCPVWAVGPGIGRRPLKVVAAVHATSEDEHEQRLNRKLIELALLMTRLEQGTLTLLQAWTAFGEDVLQHHSPADEFRAYVDAAECAARQDLTQLAASFGDRLAGVEVVLRKGPPEDVIPRFVVSQGVDLVVMGTVARTGIAGLIIGNTAERMLQRLACSVLAVKPDGFTAPVK